MVQSRELAARFDAYGEWRKRLAQGVSALHEWLKRQELADAQVDQKVQRLLARLHEDKLIVAFVAEFSRGKSELINAIFFADFGERLLPTTAGRTTMCPTELLHDASRPPSIRLLPIETRLKDASVMEFRNFPDEWVSFPLDLAVASKMRETLAKVSEMKRVPLALARALGLHDDSGAATLPARDAATEIEVPRWRHAIINVPHPLLQQGLVILDTPGLNAIGTEPELTLSLLPNAHAVLYVLAADAGVTKTDLDVWNRHLAADDDAQKGGRLVILNKIDALWDELKPAAAIDAEIDRQVATTAALLGLSPAQVHAVSAQKGLVAKVHGDDHLLARSRLPALEDALTSQLIPAKRGIVGAAAHAEVRALVGAIRSLLDARQANIAEQLAELRALRGKNQDVVEHMMQRVREEKELFERGLQRFTALRTVFTQQTNALFDVIALEALRANAGRTRRSIERSPFTKGVRTAMAEFFTSIRRDFDDAARRAGEIHEMMRAMYARFSAERGTETFIPPPFSMLKYHKEVDRLERAYNEHFNTLWNMLSKAKFALTRRFFETIASRVKHVYDVANRDVESWLRAVMSPLETQVREHHMQLRRRLESVERIHNASGELEERIGELEHQDEALTAQVATLARSVEVIDGIVLQADALPAVANAA
ncbi:MAG TPA: dynamin family protein [Casimicrobiaceae bacterium]|nr:dynamin family protein [Casimicrobiaceae bacterium]